MQLPAWLLALPLWAIIVIGASSCLLAVFLIVCICCICCKSCYCCGRKKKNGEVAKHNEELDRFLPNSNGGSAHQEEEDDTSKSNKSNKKTSSDNEQTLIDLASKYDVSIPNDAKELNDFVLGQWSEDAAAGSSSSKNTKRDSGGSSGSKHSNREGSCVIDVATGSVDVIEPPLPGKIDLLPGETDAVASGELHPVIPTGELHPTITALITGDARSIRSSLDSIYSEDKVTEPDRKSLGSVDSLVDELANSSPNPSGQVKKRNGHKHRLVNSSFAASATLQLTLQYISSVKCLKGKIKTLENLDLNAQQSPTEINFHLRLFPCKRFHMATKYRMLEDDALNLSFTMGPVSIEDLKNNKLRVKVYGKRSNRLTRSRCYGECSFTLDGLIGNVAPIEFRENVINSFSSAGSSSDSDSFM